MKKITSNEFKVTLRNDYAFKRAFGDEKNKIAVIDFISCVLDIPVEEIADIQFLDKELPKDYFSDKTGVLDVKIRLILFLKNNISIGIEMQNSWTHNFDKRILFYWSKMFLEKFYKNMDYSELTKCVIISLVGKGFRLNEKIHSTYKVLEITKHTPLNEMLEIHFLDLAKAKNKKLKTTEKSKKQLINWLKFIETDDKRERKMLSQTSQALKVLNETAQFIERTPEEQDLYVSRMMLKSDIMNMKYEGYSEGHADGVIEGRKLASKEIAKAKAETSKAKTELTENIAGAVKRMKLKGFAVEEIADLMNISIEEIEQL